jgi:alkylation response protein AidB-like acyl-CoA dehydrogenase
MNPRVQFDDPSLTPELQELQESVRKFADLELAPIADEHENRVLPIPEALLQKMAVLGYFGVSVPEEWGGSGFGALGLAVLTEELCRAWLAAGSVGARNSMLSKILLAHGTDAQKSAYVPKLAKGEWQSATAGTEPDAGSDAASIRLAAVKRNGRYVLSGTKMFCTFADRANLLIVYARTDTRATPKHRGITAFLLEKQPGRDFDPPRLTGRPIGTIGFHGLTTYELHFDGYEVDGTAILGGEEKGLGAGFYQMMTAYEIGRIQVAARSVGVAKAAWEAAADYAKKRVQFDRPIADFQAVRFKLADMAASILAAKQLVYFAARQWDRGLRVNIEAGMAKLIATEMAKRICDDALQIHGGYGYTTEFPLARYYHDARLMTLGEGTSDIQRRLIADQILGKPSRGEA